MSNECEKIDKKIKKEESKRKTRKTKAILNISKESRLGNLLASKRAEKKIENLKEEKEKLKCD